MIEAFVIGASSLLGLLIGIATKHGLLAAALVALALFIAWLAVELVQVWRESKHWDDMQ